jgi:hypothetical protein
MTTKALSAQEALRQFFVNLSALSVLVVMPFDAVRVWQYLIVSTFFLFLCHQILSHEKNILS